MKLIFSMTSVLLSVLLSGCATLLNDSYCDLTEPHLFADAHVVEWLLTNDRELLQSIVTANEKYDRLCP